MTTVRRYLLVRLTAGFFAGIAFAVGSLATALGAWMLSMPDEDGGAHGVGTMLASAGGILIVVALVVVALAWRNR